MHSTGSSQNLKRQASSETIRPSKQSRYSADGIWKGADTFSSGVARSSSPLSSPTLPTGDGMNEQPSHKNHSSTSSGAGTIHKRTLSANYAAEDRCQASAQPARVERGRQPTATLSVINVQGISADQDRSRSILDESSKENGHEMQQQPSPRPSKGKQRKEEAVSPRPPLRVMNANSEPDEGYDSDESPPPASPPCSVPSLPASIRVRNAEPQVFSSSAIVGDASTWSSPVFAAGYTAAAPIASGDAANTAAVQNGIRYAQHLARAGVAVPRVSLKIRPREAHATFWDAEDEELLTLKGRLELIDMMHETYYHHAEIVVRSYVEHFIRGLEHPDEPEFITHYKEPLRRHGSDPSGGVNVAAIEAAGAAARAQPSMRFMLDDGDEEMRGDARVKIKTSDWAELVGVPVPVWTKYFTIPIPAKFFETRESRLFRLEARVSFLSKLTSGRRYELQAPATQVSVSHLLSARELGIRKPKPSRNPFDQA